MTTSFNSQRQGLGPVQDGPGNRKRASSTSAHQLNTYQISLSSRFVVVAFLLTSISCFWVGRLARQVMVTHNFQQQQDRLLLQQQQQQQHRLQQNTQNSLIGRGLPPLYVAPHKTRPSTRYTSKHYDTGLSIGSDTLLSSHAPRSIGSSKGSRSMGAKPLSPASTSTPTTTNLTTVSDSATTVVDDDEIHEPAGQHLLIDIEHVDGAFLNSEHHLAQAMIDLVDKSGLTMLSYHCHKLLPAGVSCAGVLLESHVSFHTWPVQGVITLDLFTCGPNSLLNLLDDVKSLFAIPKEHPTNNGDDMEEEDTPKEPNIIWAFKRRGFPTDEGYAPGVSDLGSTLLGVLQFPQKEQVTVLNHPSQIAQQPEKQLQQIQQHQPQVHIYDVVNPKYSATSTDRLMYVDGILQARQRGHAAFAEALVHPAMLAHAQPKRVAIVGGSDGASLREVLKHSSVQHVEWMDMEQAVVDEISQEWLWSQCDDLLLPTTAVTAAAVTSTAVAACRDDPRVHKHYNMDGYKWFQNRFRLRKQFPAEERQDVIVMQVMNPEDEIDFSDVLLDDLDFVRLLYDGLSDNGILVVSLGTGHSLHDAPEYLTTSHDVVTLTSKLEQAGFAAIHEYEDSHSGILESATSGFLVAFKSAASNQEWFASEAFVQMKLQERIVRTKSGRMPLKYFDGATMQSYQVPSRASEVLFCKNLQGRHSSTEMNCDRCLDSGASEGSMDRSPQERCVEQIRLSESSQALLQEHLGVIGQAVYDIPSHHGVYNPIRDRNSLTQQCTSWTSGAPATDRVQSDATTERALNAPSASTATVGLRDAVFDNEGDAIPVRDNRLPNLTTSTSEDDIQESIETETKQRISPLPQDIASA